MTRRTTLLRTLALLACVALSHAVAAGAPTIEDLRKLPATGQLTFAAKNAIGEFVADRVERMRLAKTMDELRAARGDLETGYKVQSEVPYRWEYATQFAAKSPVLLGLKADPLRRVKEIYVGMIAEGMKQITIQPLLVTMTRHENAGVRYWAARAYWVTSGNQCTGRLLLQQGGRHAKAMLGTLEALGLTEASGAVLAEVMRGLSPYREVEGSLARDLRTALSKVWQARCKDLRAGKADIAEAYLKALSMVARVQVEDEKLALQLLADAMAAASLALRDEKIQKDKAAWRAFADLLKELEERLARILGPGQLPIQKILDDAKMDNDVKALEVGRKLFDVWRPKLNDRGVKAQVTPATTTAPKTQPATAP